MWVWSDSSTRGEPWVTPGLRPPPQRFELGSCSSATLARSASASSRPLIVVPTGSKPRTPGRWTFLRRRRYCFSVLIVLHGFFSDILRALTAIFTSVRLSRFLIAFLGMWRVSRTSWLKADFAWDLADGGFVAAPALAGRAIRT